MDISEIETSDLQGAYDRWKDNPGLGEKLQFYRYGTLGTGLLSLNTNVRVVERELAQRKKNG